MNAGEACKNYAKANANMQALGIHSSETAWVGEPIDHIVTNDSTIDALFEQIKSLVIDPLDATSRPLYVGLADSLHILS